MIDEELTNNVSFILQPTRKCTKASPIMSFVAMLVVSASVQKAGECVWIGSDEVHYNIFIVWETLEDSFRTISTTEKNHKMQYGAF